MNLIARRLISWIRKNRTYTALFLAFALPSLVRAIPEVLMGKFLVGFDEIGYYVPNTIVWLHSGQNFWAFISGAPLVYLLLMGVTSTGASIIWTLKIMGPVLLGLLGLAIFTYANKALFWSNKKSLLVALLATLYFVPLRI